MDHKVFQWFSEASSLGYVVAGLLLIDKTNTYVMGMDINNFSGSHIDGLTHLSYDTTSNSAVSVGRVLMYLMTTLMTTSSNFHKSLLVRPDMHLQY